MTPDYSVSLEFLRLIYPDGPWMLTAISVDKKSIDARTFEPHEHEDVLAWLRLHDKRNLYYSVNVPIDTAREKRKLAKTEVARACFVHVDVDPRVGEDLESEQERILKQLLDYRIEPTVIIFSGGGFNALWRLSEPFPIADGAAGEQEILSRATDLERRNWQMELDFDTPDHCRDVTRILRLPGTINRPNAEKIEKGRVPALATIVKATDRVYPLSTFGATPVVSTNAGVQKTRVSENVQRVESLDHLKIPDELKVIVAQGFDPKDPRRWEGDRSAALYYVCCELVRSGLDDATILGIITDSRFLISASVLDKGSGIMRYAVRQVQRARDNADHPLLAEMNERYAVILTYGNDTVIMTEQGRLNPASGRYEPVFQKFRAFKDRVKHYPTVQVMIRDKVKHISAYEWWTSHPRRRTYEDITFEPGLETPGRFNMWNGFGCDAIQGTRHEMFLQHTRENICSGNEEHYQYLLKWMARVVQTPRTQSMVVPVLLGERGTGKSMFCEFFASIFEPHRYTASDVQEITGRFNGHLASSVVVVAEEAFDLRDRRHESVLKERITGRTIGVDRKNVDIIQQPNYAHYLMTSNNERVVPAGDHERRFFVIRVSSKRRGDQEYWKALLDDRAHGGPANLLYYLKQIDLSDFDVTYVPRTKELREQQEHSLSLDMEWLLHKLESGRWFGDRVGTWEQALKRDLFADYQQYMEDAKSRTARGIRSFTQFVLQSLPGTIERQIKVISNSGQSDRPVAFCFPTLDVCRKRFCEARGWADKEWPVFEEQTVSEDAEILEFQQKKGPFE